MTRHESRLQRAERAAGVRPDRRAGNCLASDYCPLPAEWALHDLDGVTVDDVLATTADAPQYCRRVTRGQAVAAVAMARVLAAEVRAGGFETYTDVLKSMSNDMLAATQLVLDRRAAQQEHDE